MMDLENIYEQHILHIVDKNTFLKPPLFCPKESYKKFSDTYVYSWLKICAGYSNEFHEDQGPQFQ